MPAKLTFVPQLLDPHSAEPQSLPPANGRKFTLDELYRVLSCTTVEVLHLDEERILIFDEEGKFAAPAYLNLLATYLWYQYQPAARGVDAIVGRAILCHPNQF